MEWLPVGFIVLVGIGALWADWRAKINLANVKG